MVTAQDGPKYVTRNLSLFKKIPSQQRMQEPFPSLEEDDDELKGNYSQPSLGCRQSSWIRHPPARYGDSV